MNGIRPAIAQIYKQVHEAPVNFPSVISELISEYSAEDFSLAEQPLPLNEVDDNDADAFVETYAAIQRALESPVCDPSIKTKIFENTRGEPEYSFFLNQALLGIQIRGGRIILDNCNFEGLQLNYLNLSGASFMSAKFSGVTFQNMTLNQVDLSGAWFVDTVIKACDLGEASLYKALLKNCIFSLADMTGADLRSAGFDRVTFQGTIMNKCQTDDPRFLESIDQSKISMPATRIRMLSRASLNNEQQRLINYAKERQVSAVYRLSGTFSSECSSDSVPKIKPRVREADLSDFSDLSKLPEFSV